MKKNLTFFGFLLAMGLFAMSCNSLKPDNKLNTKQKLQNIVKESDQLENDFEKEIQDLELFGKNNPKYNTGRNKGDIDELLNLCRTQKAYRLKVDFLIAAISGLEKGLKKANEEEAKALNQLLKIARKMLAITTKLKEKEEELETVHQ